MTGVRSVDAPFLTDRGDVDLPAWDVVLSHFDGVITVLDPHVAASAWHAPERRSSVPTSPGHAADIHDDGRTVTLHFTGTPRAYADYPRVEVRESTTAVMMLPIGVDHPGLAGARVAYAEQREVTATLAAPLGPRVLVTADGRPVPVTPRG